MRSVRTIPVISAHGEGEVGDVIGGGVTPPPGATLWEQRRWVAEEALRNFVLNEPRGGVFRHINLRVPPKHPKADAAFILMEPEDTPPMSGPNSICVSTVLLDAGILPMQEPDTRIALEAPGGLARMRADCRDGKGTPKCLRVGDTPAIRPEISGRGWIIGIHQHMLDPSDPWPGGYRLSDTWGAR